MTTRNRLTRMTVTEHHPWDGTQHCLRDCESTCVNDHTGCLWNDGHNQCGHPARFPDTYKTFDSPLLKKDPANLPNESE